jgi:hypothetical protein
VRPILKEVIHAAETSKTAAIRKEQLALVEKLKSRGARYQHNLKTWGCAGQGAIGITCVVLATMSLGAAGLPCLIGGAELLGRAVMAQRDFSSYAANGPSA